MAQYSHFRYISKGNEHRISKRYLHCCVHCEVFKIAKRQTTQCPSVVDEENLGEDRERESRRVARAEKGGENQAMWVKGCRLRI